VSALLVSLLGALVLPLFVATWRTSLFGLACQGWLMAWLFYGAHGAAPANWLVLADLALVRGVWAPFALYQVLRRQRIASRNDLIPANLLSWFLALAAVLVAFRFSEILGSEQRDLVAVTTAGVLLGFLVLATQSGPFSQIVGVLRIENAIALFELGALEPATPAASLIQLGKISVFVLSVAFYRWYLTALQTQTSDTPEALESPTL
jgi:hydrogenase-4 component E